MSGESFKSLLSKYAVLGNLTDKFIDFWKEKLNKSLNYWMIAKLMFRLDPYKWYTNKF